MIVVYTACFGGHDSIQPVIVDSDAEFVAITDSEGPIDGWLIVNHEGLPIPDPRLLSRMYKATPHMMFPDADVWIWHDSNVQLLVPPELLVAEWLGYADLAAPKHPGRDCAYGEGYRCVEKGKDTRKKLEAQTRGYREVGYPEHNGLAETRVVIRRNTEDIVRFNEIWWGEISTKSIRDQVSFNFAVWVSRVEWKSINAWVPKHPWFKYKTHRGA